jgi:hypothetical protein
MNLRQELKEIRKDIRNLKLKAFEPNKTRARIFLDYLSWEDANARKKLEECYGKEFEIMNEWLKACCEEHGCSKDDALLRIIEE